MSTADRSLAGRRWPSLTEQPLVLLPLGSVEQHGPHLPLITDTMIATALADAVAARLASDGPAVVAPALSYGASGEHQSFPGTVSIGQDALHLLLVEYGRSCLCWADGLVVINGHGGNLSPVSRAVAQLRSEGREVAWYACDPGILPIIGAELPPTGTDSHAGLAETSIMLHLAPEQVELASIGAGVTTALPELINRIRVDGVRAVSPSGVLGDPTAATAQLGASVFSAMVGDATAAIRNADPDRVGRLRSAGPSSKYG